MNGRFVSLDLKYNNLKISTEINPFLTDISFSDSIDQADNLSINLGDRDRIWTNSWMPEKGSSIDASLLISPGWGNANSINRKLGYFEIDDISISGPPNKVSVSGTSIPESSSLKGQQKTRSWENITFEDVVKDIAYNNGMNLYFSVFDNQSYDRIDQQSESDLEFLMRICKNAGCALKIANQSICIFDEIKFENDTPVGTISRTDPFMKDYSGSDSLTGTYKSCIVSYTDPASKKTYTYTFTPPSPPKTDRILYVNESVSSLSEAIFLAKKSLRAANKETTTFSIKLAGFFNYFAGQTVNLKDFGGFDGKYLIKSVSGSVGTISEISLELRKCLVGY